MTHEWLHIERRDAPLIVSIPHAGTDLAGAEGRFVSPWLARRDADWHIPELYDFARSLGATIVRTGISRSIVDVNRHPDGVSLYPGQATTELCPTTTFDGEPLYRDGEAPDAAEIAGRRARWWAPYHEALRAEIARLRRSHERVALYDAHSIRSVVPRLFDGELPVFNLGTNSGRSCSDGLRERLAAPLAESGQDFVVDGRFKGGWITRDFGRPETGVEAVQLELACRAYMAEPAEPSPDNWPGPVDEARAAPTRATLRVLLNVLIDWTHAS
ncbi:formiminoglutamase [Roseiarcus fermentans]|uniref:Formiminoglutamase n=1 Tax=Roseiarcus fermentans TaxID=1473586 RepID=A0A366F939_9HYPH|nr:N-formylglutamate deformylase [Roseiarcus fermentans]RBP11173.1 formiminoglutamase [Roseiarcus fermentans]